MSSSLRAFALALSLASATAFAEASWFNFHLEPQLGVHFDQRLFVSGAAFKLDFGVLPVVGRYLAPEIEGFGIGALTANALSNGAAFGGGIGIRVRPFNDEKGYLWLAETPGNAWGNFWIDAHLTYSHGGLGLGFDAALGYEFSLLDGLQVGPFAKFAWIGFNTPAPLGFNRMLMFGLSFSVIIPGYSPKDTDKDGIVDTKDRCPLEAEDKDGFEDDDGCPEADNDKDGILDAKDKCPLVPEDKDGFEDDDGCPDADNDKDGILDAKDKCPSEPETKNGINDDDGCPEKDTDQDGIFDELDKCPNEPETKNGIEDEDGCPEKEAKVTVTKEKIEIKDKIFFAFNKADILPQSDALLDEIARVLKAFPQIKKISIEGHTDDVGPDAKNLILSDKRSKSVFDALVKRGVESARLTSKGFGESRPLVKGTTEKDREQNRRVEFVILEQNLNE